MPPPAAGRLDVRVALVAAAVTGCSGPQSALDPAGVGASSVAELLSWMASGAVLIWILVVGLAVYCLRSERDPPSDRAARRLILGGGAVFPTVVLTALLAVGLARMPELLTPPGEEALHVAVSGEEWWWRFRYEPPGEEPFETANELRLPVGAPVRFTVTTPDVIHSLWIPSLGPKIDLIPGRVNHLVLEPTRTGEFHGICAEYCGIAHALMAFRVVVMEPPAYEAWLAAERAPAAEAAGALELQGREAFISNGCGACHAVRGTPADGLVGPSLTHVGSRSTLAAGLLPNTLAAMRSWISRPNELKPGTHMPAFSALSDEQLDAIAAYLASLE